MKHNNKEIVGYCPQCGASLDNYSYIEGGYCNNCEEWFPNDIVVEREYENE